ncbi:MAG: CarD family transcriptional regulator [Xanthobacteraceae bacterium]
MAEKTRRRSKKSAAGMNRKTRKTSARASRRPLQSRRVTAPNRVSAAKPVPRRKPEAEAATLGMNVKKTTQRQGFKTNEFIVYPAHGVGQIMAIEEQEVAGARLELFVINFVKDKMTLRVPTSKVTSVGMRKLAETPLIRRALDTLKGRARVKRTMWSRRAQEYEAKINSGDIVAIAEVVRDLYRSENQPEQSYSERQLYEAALDRLSREISAVQRITETEAIKEIDAALAKGPRRGPKPETEEEATVADEAA